MILILKINTLSMIFWISKTIIKIQNNIKTYNNINIQQKVQNLDFKIFQIIFSKWMRKVEAVMNMKMRWAKVNINHKINLMDILIHFMTHKIRMKFLIQEIIHKILIAIQIIKMTIRLIIPFHLKMKIVMILIAILTIMIVQDQMNIKEDLEDRWKVLEEESLESLFGKKTIQIEDLREGTLETEWIKEDPQETKCRETDCLLLIKFQMTIHLILGRTCIIQISPNIVLIEFWWDAES